MVCTRTNSIYTYAKNRQQRASRGERNSDEAISLLGQSRQISVSVYAGSSGNFCPSERAGMPHIKSWPCAASRLVRRLRVNTKLVWCNALKTFRTLCLRADKGRNLRAEFDLEKIRQSYDPVYGRIRGIFARVYILGMTNIKIQPCIASRYMGRLRVNTGLSGCRDLSACRTLCLQAERNSDEVMPTTREKQTATRLRVCGVYGESLPDCMRSVCRRLKSGLVPHPTLWGCFGQILSQPGTSLI